MLIELISSIWTKLVDLVMSDGVSIHSGASRTVADAYSC
jgi:hypothetical protein